MWLHTGEALHGKFVYRRATILHAAIGAAQVPARQDTLRSMSYRAISMETEKRTWRRTQATEAVGIIALRAIQISTVASSQAQRFLGTKSLLATSMVMASPILRRTSAPETYGRFAN